MENKSEILLSSDGFLDQEFAETTKSLKESFPPLKNQKEVNKECFSFHLSNFNKDFLFGINRKIYSKSPGSSSFPKT